MNATLRLETILMNQVERMKEQQGNESRDIDDVDEEVNVKWLGHYSSVQRILLVGEGDFSFSLSLANAFGSAANIVATSLDSYDDLLRKYLYAKSNLEKLLKMGATILHAVDATRMKLHTDLNMRRFDRIVYNFPHAGFRGKEDHMPVINLHRCLVKGFFQNACHMLQPYGEVHVSHKSGGPYGKWNLKELASMFSLVLVECIDFRKEDYPGYSNKRGEGAKCDKSFHLGHSSTYIFRLGDVKENSFRLNLHSVNRVPVAAPVLLSSHLEGSFTRINRPPSIERPPILYPLADPILNLEWRREQDFSLLSSQLEGSFTRIDRPPSIERPPILYPLADPILNLEWRREQDFSLLSSHLEGSFTRIDRPPSIERPPILYPLADPILNLEWRREQDFSFYKEAIARSIVHMHEQRQSIDAPRAPPMLDRYERDDQGSQWHSSRLRRYESAEIVTPPTLDRYGRDGQSCQWHSCRLRRYESAAEIVTEATRARRVQELCQSSILRNASMRRIIHLRYLHEDICYDNYITRTG